MIEPKYYFINYECDSYTSGHGPSAMHTSKVQAITDKHPIQWQLDTNEKYDKWSDDGHGGKCREDYRVMNWQNLTVEEYKEYRYKVG